MQNIPEQFELKILDKSVGEGTMVLVAIISAFGVEIDKEVVDIHLYVSLPYLVTYTTPKSFNVKPLLTFDKPNELIHPFFLFFYLFWKKGMVA